MKIIRMILRFAATSLFRLLVITFPLVLAIVVMFHSPVFTQHTLKASGVYDHFVSAVLAQSTEKADNQETQDLLADQGVRNAAQQAVSPDILANITNQATDGIYAWLQGKTAQPEFRVDLSEAKNALTANLAQYAKTRASSLPPCTLQQVRELQAQADRSILTIPCLLPGLSPQQAADQFSSDVLQSADFLNDPVITAQDLPKDDQGRPLTEAAAWVPKAYHWLMLAPGLLGGLAVLVGACLVLLHNNRRRGVRVIGMTLLSSGAVLLIGVGFYLIFLRNPDHLFPHNQAAGIQELQTAMIRALALGIQEYIKIVGLVAGGYVVAGVAALVLGRRKRTAADTLPVPTVPPVKHGEELPPVTAAAETKTANRKAGSQ